MSTSYKGALFHHVEFFCNTIIQGHTSVDQWRDVKMCSPYRFISIHILTNCWGNQTTNSQGFYTPTKKTCCFLRMKMKTPIFLLLSSSCIISLLGCCKKGQIERLVWLLPLPKWIQVRLLCAVGCWKSLDIAVIKPSRHPENWLKLAIWNRDSFALQHFQGRWTSALLESCPLNVMFLYHNLSNSNMVLYNVSSSI